MKVTLLGLTMTGVVALVVSCSGSSTSGDQGSSGSAGKGGASSSAGTNSSSSGSSSGGNTSNAGTRNDAGTPATGGSLPSGGFNFGGFNFGGAGFNPSDYICDPVPQVGSACGAGSQPCADGTSVCYCQTGKWSCTDLGGGAGGAGPTFGQIDCPAAKPMTGEACGDTIGFCPYGGGQFMGCACYQGMWACN